MFPATYTFPKDAGEEEIIKSPYFIRTFDADWDNTYGFYEFKVPKIWKDEFESLLNGNKPSEKFIRIKAKITNGIFDHIAEIIHCIIQVQLAVGVGHRSSILPL